VVFDDSFWHEVWNESDRRRLVLILDLWHPDLSDDEVSLLSGLQRYGMVNASATRRGLARNDAARERTNGTPTGTRRAEARPSVARRRG
jgi:aspartyl/asparaginyl beta-hydroxylase (cupin superfamily)